MSWAFSPQYRFILRKRDATGAVVAYRLQSLLQCTATLLTSGGVGQLDATFADPGQQLRGAVQNPATQTSGPTPHAMNSVQLWLQNRWGQWGCAWAGYVDEVHFLHDPDRGQLLHLLCTSPYKLWEVVHVSPSDAGVLALAYSQNVSASSIVFLSADRVGFPQGMLQVDLSADSGPGYATSLIQTAFTTPEEQSWSAVLQALQSNAGVEFFADGSGVMRWRRVSFQTPPGYTPRPVSLDDILHADLSEGDRQVVTSIEVRWAYSATVAQAGTWAAPPTMAAQLGTRHLVVYAPWIQTQASAQVLATVLGEQYSAQVLQGSVTIPADPLYAVGNVVAVPALYASNPGGTTHYYLTSVAYSLEWGGPWLMTLGLTYGRSPNEQFPYLASVAPYPVAVGADTTPFALSQLTALSFNPAAPGAVQNTFRVVADPSLSTTQVSVDPGLIPVGSLLQIDDPTTKKGLGPASGAEYVAVAGQSGYILGLVGTQAAAAQVTFITVGTQDSMATVGQAADGMVGQASTGAATTAGTGFSSGNAASSAQPSSAPRTFAQKVLRIALAQAPGKYVLGATGQIIGGQQAWDCSGLVYWSFLTAGYTTPGFTDSGPNGLYHWFLAHGARAIAVADAQPGDLLFTQGALLGYTASQEGFGHVGWCLVGGANATIYGANSPSAGLGSYPVAVFHDAVGHPVTRALDMSGVTAQS